MSFVPAVSWTHRLDSEAKEEHDFSNLILEFGYAVQRQDQTMMRYCECELERMFHERRTIGRRRKANAEQLRGGD